MLINISHIQHFSVGDGDGIRTTVFFKGCNLHCPWCHNPETVSPEPQKMRFERLNREVICGMKSDTGQVLEELLEDKNYYVESGGGVTLSGGEVLMQADGAAELAALLKENGVSVAVDTAGNNPYSEFEKLNNYTDTYLYDIKSASAKQYANIIGGDLSLICENLKRLMSEGKDVRVRVPLIPNFNTDSTSVREMCRMLHKMNVKYVNLLPFHRLGSSKYDALGMEYRYRDTLPLTHCEINAIAERFNKYFTVTVEE